jgi:hypothetical protein
MHRQPRALISAEEPPAFRYSINGEEITVQTFIGAKLLSSQVAQPTQKPFEISDNLCFRAHGLHIIPTT